MNPESLSYYDEVGALLEELDYKMKNYEAMDFYRTEIKHCDNSKYIGVIQNRGEFFVKIISKFRIRNDSMCFKVRSRSGNLGIFYFPEYTVVDDEIVGAVGDCIRIKGTPIKHEYSEYDIDSDGNPLKITQWNRVKILKIVRNNITAPPTMVGR